MSQALLLPSYYLPGIEYMQLCSNNDSIIIEQFDNYTKGSYRNRVHLASASGVLRLSIPLEKGKNQRQPIKDVRISYAEGWQRIHWQSLCSCYNHSPYFEFYKDGLDEFYRKQVTYLVDWNTQLLQWLFGAIKINSSIRFTTNYLDKYDDRFIDARNLFSPKRTEGSSIVYPQVFESENGFLSNLSCIDMLFNIGAQDMLKKIKP